MNRITETSQNHRVSQAVATLSISATSPPAGLNHPATRLYREQHCPTFWLPWATGEEELSRDCTHTMH